MEIQKNIYGVGVKDCRGRLFEGQYLVQNGISYNSYVILDEKIAVLDTVDEAFGNEWLQNVKIVLNGKQPDFLIVQHMEPDHSANILAFARAFPSAKIVASSKAFVMMKNYFGDDFSDKQMVVSDGDELDLGIRKLRFFAAPMVHWPEVILTLEQTDKILFSADAFGKFGAEMDEIVAHEKLSDKIWADEAARYYIGIVGKYGVQVQTLLKKLAGQEIQTICPLHGPVLKGELAQFLSLYDVWSAYGVEKEGVLLAYTSVYGNTKKTVELLAQNLRELGCKSVLTVDLAVSDMAWAVAEAFRYGKIVLATTTYNGEIFPFMRAFIEHLTERNFQNKKIGFIENGSWAPVATRVMRSMLEKCKNLQYADATVKILSAMTEENKSQISALAKELCE